MKETSPWPQPQTLCDAAIETILPP